jgi:transposase
VEQWAEIRRLHFVAGVGIREIARRTGFSRQTIRRAVRSDSPPRYERPLRGSKLDAYRGEVHRLLGEHPRLPGTRVRELLEPLGYDGSKTILDDYLREVRPLFVRPRTFQRTVYRPGDVCQFDLWEPREQIPVGYGQTRRGWVVVACLGYSRAGAGTLIFSKQAEDILSVMTRCLWAGRIDSKQRIRRCIDDLSRVVRRPRAHMRTLRRDGTGFADLFARGG